MSVKTDEHGQVQVPHHDGDLDGIMCGPDGSTVTIHYRCTGGVRRVIRLLGVHEMDVSSFRNGNIIMSFMVHPAEDASSKATESQLRRLGYGRPGPLKGKFLFLMDHIMGLKLKEL